MSIHRTAIVDPKARLGSNVEIGPYSVVGAEVVLGNGVVLHAHVVVDGNTHVGEGTEVFPFAALGARPQDRRVQRTPVATGKLRIGCRNVIRESVTIHPGTPTGSGLTQVGDDCMLLAGSHIAHDARVGNRVTMTNLASIAGHSQVGDGSLLGAFVGLHQFARVGEMTMIAAGAMVSQDVPPFCMAQGDRAKLVGLNQVGLRRAGIEQQSYFCLREAFRGLFWNRSSLSRALEDVERRLGHDPHVRRIIAFMRESQRGVCPARRPVSREERLQEEPS